MINWTRVQELRDEIGPEGFVEVADMFLEEANQAVAALVSGRFPEEIENYLHFLKGSALNLGFDELAAICREGERKAAAGYGALVDTALVAWIYQSSRDSLLGGLEKEQAA